MYAVVQSGGQQHKVKVGQTLMVEKIAGAAEAGARVELDRVLAIGGDDGSTIGTPIIAGARVIAEVLDPDAKGKKLIVFKYKAKVRYRRKTGHRQHYTQLRVTEIVPGDGSASVGSASARGTTQRARSTAAPAAEAARDAAGAGEKADQEPAITAGLVAEAARDVAAVAAEAAADLGGQAIGKAQEVGADAVETVVDKVKDVLPGGDDQAEDKKKE